jgi:hypothetical protein
MNSEEIKKLVLERVMAPYPKNSHIVPYSTPVVSFGNPETSTVATLGINPSSGEFIDKGKNLLAAEAKRLVDLETLGLPSETDQLDLEQAEKVLSGCVQYFDGTTTYGWFLRLQEYVLDSVNASYKPSAGEDVEGACHLDLVQWATDPVWRDLDKGVRETLLESDLEFLRFQLTNYKFKKLFLNGSEVIKQFNRLGITTLTEVGKTSYQSGNGKSSLYRGKYGDTEVWGWGLNVGQKEITLSNLEDLSNWIGDDSADGDPLKFDLSQAIIAYGDSRKKKYPSNDVSKITAVAEEFGLAKFEVKAKFVRDVNDILHIHPDMLVARQPFQGSRDRRLTNDNPYPNYPHFFQLSGWSNTGSKALESQGIEKVLCPVGFVGVLPDVVCDYCEEIHPKKS